MGNFYTIGGQTTDKKDAVNELSFTVLKSVAQTRLTGVIAVQECLILISLLAKSGRAPYEVLKEIRGFIGEEAELHVQVVAKDAKGMVEDAHRIVKESGKNTYVKVPSVPEGFKAMKVLASENINITATAIYTPMQAFLAAKCGASYAAPYVNRIDNMGFNGIQVTKQIHDIFKNKSFNSIYDMYILRKIFEFFVKYTFFSLQFTNEPLQYACM